MTDESSPLLGEICGNVERQVEEQPRPSYLVVIVPMAIGVFLEAMDRTLVFSCYASIGSEFKQLQNTSWIATSYLLTNTSFQPLYGKLSDIYGRKTCLLFAYIVFAMGCMLCGLSRNLTELVVSRAIAGIGGGGMQTMVSIIVSDIVTLRNRGTWQGVLNLIWAAGNTFGAALGGYLSDTIGWRWAFLIQVPLTVAAFVSVSLALDLPKKESGDFIAKLKRVDFGGTIALVMTVLSLLYGMDRGGNISWYDRLTIMSLLASGVFFSLFSFIEMELAKEPFVPRRIIADRALIASYFVNLFSTAASFCLLFYLPLFFQAVQALSASETGLWLIISVVGSVAGSLTGGLSIQATGKYYGITVLGCGLLLWGTIVVTLATSPLWLSSEGIAVGLLLTSFGNGSGITTTLISLIANVGQEDQAIATAVSYLFRSLGSVVGLSIGSTLIQSVLRSSLREKLSDINVDEITRKVRESLKYLDELDPDIVRCVREAYAEAIQISLWFTVVLALLAFISSILIREKTIGDKWK